uniref:uncharacterized protein LOC120334795 n=1 Tax=Styela clava TaxID=7725 RepID=UPI00193AADE1|nr:uncharacterized protein LOC120334795 [Styela clava]
MEDIFKCYSCGTKFETTGPKEPQVLPCQHTFCKVCIFKLLRTNSTKCPTCCEVHPAITAANRNLIRTNLTIIRLLEAEVSVPEVQKNETIHGRHTKLEFLKVYIVCVISWVICVVSLPDFNVMELRKPSKVLGFFILPFISIIEILKGDMEDIAKYINFDLILWMNAICIVTVLNFISPVIKQLVIRFLKAPVWKVGIMVIWFAIVVQCFVYQAKV